MNEDTEVMEEGRLWSFQKREFRGQNEFSETVSLSLTHTHKHTRAVIIITTKCTILLLPFSLWSHSYSSTQTQHSYSSARSHYNKEKARERCTDNNDKCL